MRDSQVQGAPELAAPWSPPGVLDVATDLDGNVNGMLTFGQGIALKVCGSIRSATDKSPASVDLTGEGLGSINRIKGHFVPGSDHVVGTILCVANDLLKQPNGTLGPFVLWPMKG